MTCGECLLDFARWLSWGSLLCAFLLGGWFGMFIMALARLMSDRERAAEEVACECEKQTRDLDS